MEDGKREAHWRVSAAQAAPAPAAIQPPCQCRLPLTCPFSGCICSVQAEECEVEALLVGVPAAPSGWPPPPIYAPAVCCVACAVRAACCCCSCESELVRLGICCLSQAISLASCASSGATPSPFMLVEPVTAVAPRAACVQLAASLQSPSRAADSESYLATPGALAPPALPPPTQPLSPLPLSLPSPLE
eukprot:scaffold180128_cov35-Tisochrysis_lutea.AAC.2